MAMYVLVRSPDSAFVARSGLSSSYTHDLLRAKTFATVAEAERDRCLENERIVRIDSLFAEPCA